VQAGGVYPGSHLVAGLLDGIAGEAPAFDWPMLTALATVTARLIEWRSVHEARLTDEEVT
jgi:hypothetical protein